ncbi:MAG: hypothetical protein NTV88_00170 [Candidatus Micrarchaeota archaeon]|nr:hypothetical protein [Candidatus Micrarchaeota archaeon]
MVKRIFGINFFDAFIAGAMTVTVPLMMADRGIGIATIGLVFGAAPILKLLVRIGASALADTVGERSVYVLSALGNIGQSVTYAFAYSPLAFGVGKTFDAVRESTLWAVNRASVIAAAPDRGHFALGGLLSGRYMYNAAGSLCVGMLFAAGGYNLLLAAAVTLSLFMLLAALGVKSTNVKGVKVKLSDFSYSGRSKLFLETAGAQLVGSAFYVATIYTIIPIYFLSLGLSLGQIGALYAGYFLIEGSVLNAISHKKISTAKIAYVSAAMFVVCLLGMALVPLAAAGFFLVMAIGDGALSIAWEEANYRIASRSKRKATDLTALSIPSYLGVASATAVSGFVAASYGYLPIFLACAVSEVGFALWCLRLRNVKG